MNPVATILIPTHDHGPTLRASVASALQQTQPVEVFVVGDGVPEETRAILGEITQSDQRVRFFDREKGPRHGEAYRHEALQQASGRIVCYLSDDDIYLPRHVDVMSHLLEDADFAHAVPVDVLPEGGVVARTVDLALPAYQRELLEGRNRIPLSAGAHTLSAYQALDQGWSAAPAGTPTDLYMWQKFLRHSGCRFRAAESVTVLSFPAQPRRTFTQSQRYEELRLWMTRLSDHQAVAELNHRVLAQKIQEAAELDARLVDAIHNAGMLTPWESVLQVFFPHPDGYNERDSACFPVRLNTWQKVALDIPCAAEQVQIRIDPANTPCLIELARLRVYDAGGTLLWALGDHNAHTLELGGTSAAVSRGPLLRIVSDGDDPQIALPPIAVPSGTAHVRLEVMVRLDAELRPLTGVLGAFLRIPAL